MILNELPAWLAVREDAEADWVVLDMAAAPKYRAYAWFFKIFVFLWLGIAAIVSFIQIRQEQWEVIPILLLIGWLPGLLIGRVLFGLFGLEEYRISQEDIQYRSKGRIWNGRWRIAAKELKGLSLGRYRGPMADGDTEAVVTMNFETSRIWSRRRMIAPFLDPDHKPQLFDVFAHLLAKRAYRCRMQKNWPSQNP